MFSTRATSALLVPVTTVAAYAAYVRSTSQPAQAHSNIMTLNGSDRSGHEKWRKINNGLGLVDVGRSCGAMLVPLLAQAHEAFRTSHHVVISVTVGGSSHAKWVLEIGEVLALRGHRVTFITRDDHLTLASAYKSIRTISVGPSVYGDVGSTSDSVRRLSHFAMVSFFRSVMNKAYATDLPLYWKYFTDDQPSVAICDAFASGCIDIAYEKKVPLVVTCSGIINQEISLPYVNSLGSSVKTTSLNMGLWERFQQKYVDMIRLVWHVYPQIRQLDQLRQQHGLRQTGIDVYAKWTNALRLVNGFFGFAPAQPLGPLTHMVGPIINAERQPELSSHQAEFLATHHRVAYVAFGQTFQPEHHGFRVLAGALLDQLEAGHLDGVIWARFNYTLPGKTSSNRTRQPVSLTDTCHDLSKLDEPLYRKWFLLLDWAPQFAILRHPSTRLFVSHGGAESAHEALYNGVPLLIHPFVGDQGLNGNALEAAGVAMFHDRDKCTLEQVKNQIEYLLEDENGYVSNNLTRMQTLAKIGSQRKYYAADLIEEHMFASIDGVPIHRQDVSRNMSWMKARDLDLHVIVIGVPIYVVLLIHTFLTRRHVRSDRKVRFD
ncbi:hypothetical protein DFQ28_002527 [Apophysomyces sp. BC1034]|nr:hypothetical protein DFQ28_002527 [Apophysomyces sp. BC1034]